MRFELQDDMMYTPLVKTQMKEKKPCEEKSKRKDKKKDYSDARKRKRGEYEV